MTDILINTEEMINSYVENKMPSIFDVISLYFRVKEAINTDKAKELMKNYIIKDKTINSGKATIKGTRLTPEDIGRALENCKTIEGIMEEYPSLSNKEEVHAALFYYMKQNVSLIRLVLFR